MVANPKAVGMTLVREEEGVQQPVYYISQVLRGAKPRHPNMEKLTYALIMASRKLRHYFQGRKIKVMTNQPLKKILFKPYLFGRLVAWAVELSQYHIEYQARSIIKGQEFVDFIVECTFSKRTVARKRPNRSP